MSGAPLKDADLTAVPANLPVPDDDGACDHLRGLRVPSIALASTDGGAVDLSTGQGISIVFFYPMTGRPGVALPEGWDQIPGARGEPALVCFAPGELGRHRPHYACFESCSVETLGALCMCPPVCAGLIDRDSGQRLSLLAWAADTFSCGQDALHRHALTETSTAS